jgi:aspartate/methionine/tyrosine aminotransferase
MRVAQRISGLGITLIRKMMADAPPHAINLGLGETNLPVPECIQERAHEPGIFTNAQYGANAGIAELRRRVAEKYGASPENVIVTSGVQEALSTSILGLVGPGDEVLHPDPAFPVYSTLATIAGASNARYSLGESEAFRPTWDAIEAKLTDRTRLVVLCSPNNPTGTSATPAQWRKIGENLERLNIPYLSDEIYLDLQSQPAHGSMWNVTPRGIVAAGLAKSHALAGWRLGWMIAPLEIAPQLTALHQQLVTSASTLVQHFGIGAFSREGQEFVQSLRLRLDTNRERARELMLDAGFDVASGESAFYLWVRVPGQVDDLDFCVRALKAGVIVIPGSAFGPGGCGFFRLSFSVEMPLLEEGIQRLRNFRKEQFA